MRPLTYAFALVLAAHAYAAPIPDLTLTPIPVTDRLAVNPDVVTLMPDGRIGFGNSVGQRFGSLGLDGSGTSFPFTLPDGRLESHAIAAAGPDTVAIIGRVINSDATQAFRSVIIEGNVVNGQFQVHDIPTQDACFNVANRCDIVGLTAGGVVYTMGDQGRVGLLSPADVFREQLIVIPNPRGTPRINAITRGPGDALYMTDARNELVIRMTQALDGFTAFPLDPGRTRSRMDPYGIAPFGSDSVVITESGLAPEGGKIGIVNISTGAFREIEPSAAAQFLQEIATVSADSVLAIDEFKRELALVNINTGEVLQSQTADRPLDVLPLPSSSPDKTRVFIPTLNLSQGFDVTPQIAEFSAGGAKPGPAEAPDLTIGIRVAAENACAGLVEDDEIRSQDTFEMCLSVTNVGKLATLGEIRFSSPLPAGTIGNPVIRTHRFSNVSPFCEVRDGAISCSTVATLSTGLARIAVEVLFRIPRPTAPPYRSMTTVTAAVSGGGDVSPGNNNDTENIAVLIDRAGFVTAVVTEPTLKTDVEGRKP